MLRADTLTADCHVILLAEHYDSKACAAGLAAGGDDMFGKDRPFDELVGRIRVGIRMCGLQMELKRAAITDPLTGLHNRRYFYRMSRRCVEKATRDRTPISILLLDIDFFKQYNDTNGHDEGDRLLIEFAGLLRGCTPDDAVVARYGGEEFIVLMPGVSTVLSSCRAVKPSSSMAGRCGGGRKTSTSSITAGG
jgi:two-component system cell cycle response regulator